ncbi:DinB family protein [Alkalicoccus halolimnae]|uniref:DinB family protein n=1 Tax=Alkalicoccus halolimnae TaxID=1667239 RepID=A0A5C7F3Q1_9BACI|nr:DinB family protein [Alkalicoccus halolimnae]TXF85291.1 DinB family protein [Alkalicoccus halolimnae]
MNKYKKDILDHQIKSIEFVKSLHSISEDQWRTPVKEGKWTIAEIIGHFKPWDEFVMKHRLPYLFSAGELPKGPDAQKINVESAAVSRIKSKQETLDTFIITREKLYGELLQIPDELWEREFSIGTSKLNLYDYLRGLAAHDCHHFEQIKNTHPFLKQLHPPDS